MAFCIMFVNITTIFAGTIQDSSETTVIIDEVYDDIHIVVTTETDEDGNDVFIQYNNGELFEKVVLQRNEKKIFISNEQNSRTVEEVVDISDFITQSEVLQDNNTTRAKSLDKFMGTITYKTTDVGNLKANVSYSGKEKRAVSYDIYGAEKSLAGWIALIAGGLALPSAIAGDVIATWASRFGFVLSTGQVLLPDTHAIATPIEYTVTTTDITNGSGGRKGTFLRQTILLRLLVIAKNRLNIIGKV